MIVYFSTFLSPHVKPFCDYLYEKTGGRFVYVETQKLSEERRAMGYSFDGQNIPYLQSIVNDKEKWYSIADQSDCVLINPGSSDYTLTEYCVKHSRIVFFVSERLFKKGPLKIIDLRLWKQAYINLQARKRNVYLLCLGYYVSGDFSLIGFNKNRAYKFGYFPESRYRDEQQKKQEDNYLLWVGRLINWKRPIFALRIIKKLNKKNIDTHLLLAGDGPQKKLIQHYITTHKLEDRVKLLGFVDNDQVRKLMNGSKACLSTSTRQEGWGAVINEALDAGVPVVASSSVGAAGYLIEDGKNGFTFNTYSVRSAVSAIERMNKSEMSVLRKNAKDTLRSWNAEVAGDRFLKIYELIKGGNSSPDVFSDGPMSRA